jgi:hypothetical protein
MEEKRNINCTCKNLAPYWVHFRDCPGIGFGWNIQDLEDLDRKFDALCEFLKVEFVFEKISDGSEWADSERWYVREKQNRPT